MVSAPHAGITLARQTRASGALPPGCPALPSLPVAMQCQRPRGAGSRCTGCCRLAHVQAPTSPGCSRSLSSCPLPAHSPAPDASIHACPSSLRGFPASPRVPSRHCSSVPSAPVPRHPHHHRWRGIERKPPPQTLHCVRASSPFLLGAGTPRSPPTPGPTPCSRGSAWEARGLSLE